MCGRFRLSHRGKLAEHFDLPEEPEFEPRYNIAPTQQVGIVRQTPTRREFTPREFVHVGWGLIPSWAADAKIGASLINARAESLIEKPSFKESFRTRRCLVPADGFYEWKKAGKSRQPFCFTLCDDSLFAFAGLWDSWKAPDGNIVESCSIITTAPNTLCAEVHDRMPVILDPAGYDTWLSPLSDVERLSGLLQPFHPEKMQSYPVSSAVNSAATETPECSQPITDPLPDTPMLF